MRKPPAFVSVSFVKCNRAFLYSVVAIMIFVYSNINVIVAQTVDPGFNPCSVGLINQPAICNRTATCTSVGAFFTRVTTIVGFAASTKACPGTAVYNLAELKLMVGNVGVSSVAQSQLIIAAGPVMEYVYGSATCSKKGPAEQVSSADVLKVKRPVRRLRVWIFSATLRAALQVSTTILLDVPA